MRKINILFPRQIGEERNKDKNNKKHFQNHLLPDSKWESTFFSDPEAGEKDRFPCVIPYPTLVVGT